MAKLRRVKGEVFTVNYFTGRTILTDIVISSKKAYEISDHYKSKRFILNENDVKKVGDRYSTLVRF